MNLKEQYLRNPCKTLSIPYWKHIVYKQPSTVKITHQDDVKNTEKTVNAKRFFRLINHLENEYSFDTNVELIDTSKDIEELVNMINESYKEEHITVNKAQVLSWMDHNVYDQTLWVKIEKEGRIIASGIAEIDYDLKEGILEWIQVRPEEQGKGYGQTIVHALLHQLKKKADFVTVGGHLDNKTSPKKLYEQCHFTGNDIWIITQE